MHVFLCRYDPFYWPNTTLNIGSILTYRDRLIFNCPIESCDKYCSHYFQLVWSLTNRHFRLGHGQMVILLLWNHEPELHTGQYACCIFFIERMLISWLCSLHVITFTHFNSAKCKICSLSFSIANRAGVIGCYINLGLGMWINVPPRCAELGGYTLAIQSEEENVAISGNWLTIGCVKKMVA